MAFRATVRISFSDFKRGYLLLSLTQVLRINNPHISLGPESPSFKISCPRTRRGISASCAIRRRVACDGTSRQRYSLRAAQRTWQQKVTGNYMVQVTARMLVAKSGSVTLSGGIPCEYGTAIKVSEDGPITVFCDGFAR